jgi:ribosomal protein S18 acetylase RimI-like enzyme
VAARPFENAFLHWVLDGGHGPYAPDELSLDRKRDGTVRGVIYYGAQLVVAAEDVAALDAFAIETRKYPGLRSFVGPKRAVDGIWNRVKSWHRAPALVREHQPLYALWPQGLNRFEDADVRLARSDETELVAEHSARMILGELGYDPRAQRSTFVAGVRHAIELGSWWVWIVEGELRFQCNVGASTPVTAQIQGVWTPPPMRGRGYATRALAATANRLLARTPTVSLYVNDFNAEAISLYDRIGFTRVGELATYLFP